MPQTDRADPGPSRLGLGPILLFKRNLFHSSASFTAKQTRAQTTDAIGSYESICSMETSVIETETQTQRTDNFFATIKGLWL